MPPDYLPKKWYRRCCWSTPYGLRPIREVLDVKLQTRWDLHPVEAPIARQMVRLAVEENRGSPLPGTLQFAS